MAIMYFSEFNIKLYSVKYITIKITRYGNIEWNLYSIIIRVFLIKKSVTN